MARNSRARGRHAIGMTGTSGALRGLAPTGTQDEVPKAGAGSGSVTSTTGRPRGGIHLSHAETQGAGMPESPGSGLRVGLRPTFAVAAALVAAHAGGVLGAFALPLSPWSTSIVAAALLASAWRNLMRHAFRRGPGAVVAISHSQSEGWWVTTAAGARIGPCTLRSAFVHPRLTILSFMSPRGAIDVLAPERASDPDEARRLRILLRRLSSRVAEHSDAGVLARVASSIRQRARRR